MAPLITRELDLRGLNEPMPVFKTHKAIDGLQTGDILLVTTTDRGTLRDFDSYCERTGCTVLQSTEEDNIFTFLIRKEQQPNWLQSGHSRHDAG